MKDIPLSSGATLSFQLAKFQTGMKLFNAVLKELVGVPMGSAGAAFDLASLFQLEPTQIKDIVIKVSTSEEVQAIIWKCMESCLYKGINDGAGLRITETTFESEKNRSDFLPVAWEVATNNLIPFFKNLGSLLSTQSVVPTNGNEQKSETN